MLLLKVYSAIAFPPINYSFAIRNVPVMKMTPLRVTFKVRLWRYKTEEEKKVNPAGSITARSIMPPR